MLSITNGRNSMCCTMRDVIIGIAIYVVPDTTGGACQVRGRAAANHTTPAIRRSAHHFSQCCMLYQSFLCNLHRRRLRWPSAKLSLWPPTPATRRSCGATSLQQKARRRCCCGRTCRWRCGKRTGACGRRSRTGRRSCRAWRCAGVGVHSSIQSMHRNCVSFGFQLFSEGC